MSDAILTLLRLGFLGLLWVFFARVAASVWQSSSVRTATPQYTERIPRRKKRAASQTSVVILEPVDQAGLVYVVDGQLTIGRSASCEMILDDTFVSSQHARLTTTDAGMIVSDLGSTNGTYVDRQRVSAPIQVDRGARVQVGSTVMEIR